MMIEGMASKPLTIVLRIDIVEGMASMIEFLAFVVQTEISGI